MWCSRWPRERTAPLILGMAAAAIIAWERGKGIPPSGHGGPVHHFGSSGRKVVPRRALATGSEHDIQFNDLGKAYTFGVAVFHDAQVRHAFNPEPAKLSFGR